MNQGKLHCLFRSLSQRSVPCIIHGTMFRAEVEPMLTNPPDRLPRTGLWKVVIYEDDRFVRTDKEYIIISKAERIAEELNYMFGNKKAKGATK